MKRNNDKWTSGALLASLGAAVLMATAVPQQVEAQRAAPRGTPSSGQSTSEGRSRGGGSADAPSGSGAERRAAPPQTSAPAPDTAAPRGQTAATAGAADEGPHRSDRSGVRRRGDSPQTGVAVARRVSPGSGGRPVIVPGGWYPWGWGGYGFGGYYGFYDPWYYGGHGYRYNQPIYLRRDDGTVRLKVTPRDASVYVDGYYAGVVDDFDGFFQRLPLEPGPHRIEMQLDGYAPLTFDVRILPERRTTFEGELKPLAP